MLLELRADALVEEPDLREGQLAGIREARIVAADLEEHLAVDGPEGVPRPPSLALPRQPLVDAVADERRGDGQLKKRAAKARQILRSRFAIFAYLVIGCFVMSAIAANILVTSWFFFFWSIAMRLAPVASKNVIG